MTDVSTEWCTSPGLAEDARRLLAGFSGPRVVDGHHAELVLLALLQPRHVRVQLVSRHHAHLLAKTLSNHMQVLSSGTNSGIYPFHLLVNADSITP